MAFSNYLKAKLVEHILGSGFTSPEIVWFAVGTAEPSSDGTWEDEIEAGAETGYERQPIVFAAPDEGSIVLGEPIRFCRAVDDWGTLEYWAAYDASSAGNMLAYGQLLYAPIVSQGDTLIIRAGDFYLSMQAGGGSEGWSDYSIQALLNHAFRHVALSPPAVSVALLIDYWPDPSDSGGDLVEPSGGGYSRQTPDWTDATAEDEYYKATNDADVSFGPATSGWGYPSGCALCDSSSVGGGNMLMWHAPNLYDEVKSGDEVLIPQGELGAYLS